MVKQIVKPSTTIVYDFLAADDIQDLDRIVQFCCSTGCTVSSIASLAKDVVDLRSISVNRKINLGDITKSALTDYAFGSRTYTSMMKAIHSSFDEFICTRSNMITLSDKIRKQVQSIWPTWHEAWISSGQPERDLALSESFDELPPSIRID
jgi:hypothetical protein